jgi:uncharacterized protein (TIGR00730 family)
MPQDSTAEMALDAEIAKNHLLIRQRLINTKEDHLGVVTDEFEKAFDILGKYPNTVTVFGSARLPQDHPSSKQAFAASWALAKHGFAVVTGGGGGIMQAANHGAKKAGGTSIGFNIHLPTEQVLNKHTTDHYQFEHFFSRKVAMTLDASGYIFCAGGFGTFDEMFEIITLTQTGMIPRVPIILLGEDFWKPLDEFIKKTLIDEYQTVEPIDRELYTITDDMSIVIDKITTHTKQEAYEEMHSRAARLQKRWASMHEAADESEIAVSASSRGTHAKHIHEAHAKNLHR